jgi:hypothetical protein
VRVGPNVNTSGHGALYHSRIEKSTLNLWHSGVEGLFYPTEREWLCRIQHSIGHERAGGYAVLKAMATSRHKSFSQFVRETVVEALDLDDQAERLAEFFAEARGRSSGRKTTTPKTALETRARARMGSMPPPWRGGRECESGSLAH